MAPIGVLQEIKSFVLLFWKDVLEEIMVENIITISSSN